MDAAVRVRIMQPDAGSLLFDNALDVALNDGSTAPAASSGAPPPERNGRAPSSAADDQTRRTPEMGTDRRRGRDRETAAPDADGAVAVVPQAVARREPGPADEADGKPAASSPPAAVDPAATTSEPSAQGERPTPANSVGATAAAGAGDAPPPTLAGADAASGGQTAPAKADADGEPPSSASRPDPAAATKPVTPDTRSTPAEVAPAIDGDAAASDDPATPNDAPDPGEVMPRPAAADAARDGTPAGNRPQTPQPSTAPPVPTAPTLAAAASAAVAAQPAAHVPPGDLPPDMRADGATHPSGARTAERSIPRQQARPPSPMRMDSLALRIVQANRGGHARFEIQLDPPELGRIDVKLDIGTEGQLRAHLAADRPETYDLLQRDGRALQKALESAGLKLSGDSLAFSLRDQGSGNRSAGDDSGRDHGQGSDAPAGDDAVTADIVLDRSTLRAAMGGIDRTI